VGFQPYRNLLSEEANMMLDDIANIAEICTA
jgi:hypothetical protein